MVWGVQLTGKDLLIIVSLLIFFIYQELIVIFISVA